MIKADRTLGILERTFDKIALALHICESFRGCFGPSVTKAVLYGLSGPDFSSDEEMPLADGVLVIKPDPDALGENIDIQSPFGGITNGDTTPCLLGLVGSPISHSELCNFGCITGRCPATNRLALRDERYWVLKINGLILVDVGNKLLSLVIKGFQEVRVLAVAAVNPDPGKP